MLGCRVDYFLSQKNPATTFDHVEFGIDLICTIKNQINFRYLSLINQFQPAAFGF